MSLLSFLGVQDVYAATPAAGGQAPSVAEGFLQMLPMLILFVAVFYFLLVRPQTKRAKEQRQMMDHLAVGDEVVTAGGMLGKIVKLSDQYVTVAVSKSSEIVVQKNSVVSILPKGTIDSI